MTTSSRIEWTEQTWNPIVGCTKISAGCKHCYAEVMARRLQAMGTPGYENGFALRLIEERLSDPMKRKSHDLLRELHVRSVPRESAVRIH